MISGRSIRLQFVLALGCWLALCAGTPALAQAESSNAAPEPVQTPPGFQAAPTETVGTSAPSPVVQTNTSILTNRLVSNPEPHTNSAVQTETEQLAQLRSHLETARHLRHTRQPQEAEPLLVELLADTSPDSIKQQALLELAAAARDENDLPRAQQIYAQFLNRWPNDLLVPEILLRQGQLFREMGLNNLALAKFYAVMTSALVLKNDMLDYYQRLVLLAQTEIAESHYELGKYADAAEFFSRLLKQNSPGLDRALAQFRLVRSLSALSRSAEVVAQAQDFLVHFPGDAEQPEVRFRLALALKQLGRNNEAMQQVLTLLQEEKAHTKDHPELWAYWQQRAGNEIGNQLYREGDYTKALGIYLTLEQLDPQPSWQLPVAYQIGLTYERLSQPEKAIQTYQDIIKREPELGTNATPGLNEIMEMARWRTSFLKWQSTADTVARPTKPLPALQPQAAAKPVKPALPEVAQ